MSNPPGRINATQPIKLEMQIGKTNQTSGEDNIHNILNEAWIHGEDNTNEFHRIIADKNSHNNPQERRSAN